MAISNWEAWITVVAEDDDVTTALILVDSLKRTKTGKTIAVITCENVSAENRTVLRAAFDAFFFMDGSLLTKDKSIEDQSKIYAANLRLFSKCIFISPRSLVLENADDLFEVTQVTAGSGNVSCKQIDFSIFLFTPSDMLSNYIEENLPACGEECAVDDLKTWINVGLKPVREDAIMKLLANTGSIQKPSTKAKIVQLVGKANQIGLYDQLKALSTIDLGLCEKIVVETWLSRWNAYFGGMQGDPATYAIIKTPTPHQEPIAIIGMSCRYPGANNVEEFWNLLYQGKDGISEPPVFRWTKEHSLRVTSQERKTNAGFLSCRVDEFDARFFGISPKEAQFMDPQARLLHEVLWESLEDSGIDPFSLHGTHAGVFTGSWMNDYKDIVQGSAENDFFRSYMGNGIGSAAARLSFLLGLTGPSIATESGCSSAIVALDLAVKSLRNGETNLAVAGGVNLLLHPFTSSFMDHVISSNGRCKTFDASADGFGRAEGCGVLVLKRLSDALANRDKVWAVIRGSAISQEGLSKSLGTPTVHSEALAMQMALTDANVSPNKVTFIEAHGTGTAVGDPMEIAAITKAYSTLDRTTPLIIGSVKTNVGHTESCSGITGIMKTVLAMQHEIIPKHLNLETLNPEIQLDRIPARIPMEPVPWPKVKGFPRIAGVSSFGITGTDGHAIIQEAPDYQLPKFSLDLERPLHIMKISAKTNESLEDLLAKYEETFCLKNEHLSKSGETFADAAYTANIGRASFNHCSFIIASNYSEAAKALQQDLYQTSEISEPGKICFLFTGQGSQYSGMAKMLYETSPVFRIHFDHCDKTLQKLYGLSIANVLWNPPSNSEEIHKTIYSQTSIFCVEYCLLKLWESWGILPDYVLGHSLGEFAAAVAADILEFEDGLKLVVERSRLIENLPQGSMLVVRASLQQVYKYLSMSNIDLDIAATNNAEQTVVAGETPKVEKFQKFLKNNGVKAIILAASHAFHSRHMDPMLEAYRKVAESVTYKTGNQRCKYISGMQGELLEIPSQSINAEYWVRHTRDPVSFIRACQVLKLEDCHTFIELGPQPILSSFVTINNETTSLTCLPSLRRGTNDWKTILTSLGKLYLLGHQIDWKGFDEPYNRKKISLPFYPFQRKSFWVETTGTNSNLIHPLLGYSLSNASNISIFQNDMNIKSAPYLRDHCIGSRIVFPGAGYTEMCLTAAYAVSHSMTENLEQPLGPLRLENVRFDAPLELKEDTNCRIQVLVDLPEVSGERVNKHQFFRAKVYHQNNLDKDTGKWVSHAVSSFYPSPGVTEVRKKCQLQRISEMIQSLEPISTRDFYNTLNNLGLKFGESFKSIQRYWKVIGRTGNEILAELRIPSDFQKYVLHPLVIDAMFQAKILAEFGVNKNCLKVPVSFKKLTLLQSLEAKNRVRDVAYVHVWWEGQLPYICLIDSNSDLTPIAIIEDLEMVETSVKTIESILEQQSSTIPDVWEEVWKPIPGLGTDQIKLPEIFPSVAGNQMSEICATEADILDVARETNRLIYLCCLNALYRLGWVPSQGGIMGVAEFCKELQILPSFYHLVHFYFSMFEQEAHWMVYEPSTQHWKVIQVPPAPEHIEREMLQLFVKLKAGSTNDVINIYEHMSTKLPQILEGTESAQDILFPIDPDRKQFSADRFYQKYPARVEGEHKLSGMVSTVLEAARDINPDTKTLRVLEVGAGTGSLTVPCLDLIAKKWGNRFEYYFTDISKAFFARKFEAHQQNLTYTMFNIESAPLEQGIPLEYFDLVLCTDVIHATRNLEESLTHLRQTLRPGGFMAFTETITVSRPLTFVYGLLDGYWRMEDLSLRPHHCCVTEHVWRQMLEKAEFRSVSCLQAYGGEIGCFTAKVIDSGEAQRDESHTDRVNMKQWLFFTTACNKALLNVAKSVVRGGSQVTLVLHPNDDISKMNGFGPANIVFTRADGGSLDEILNLVQNANLHGIVYGWGMDINEHDQSKLAQPLLLLAQTLLTIKKPPKLFILSQGVHCVAESLVANPSAATLFGCAKSLFNENAELFVRYVDLELSTGTEMITKQVLYELAMTRETNRVQVVYRQGVRYEPKFCKTNGAVSYEQLTLPPCTNRYQLVLPKSRLLQDLRFQAMQHEDHVQGQEVEVKVKAYGLNFKDVLTVLKPGEEFERLNHVGIDFAGEVSRVGPKVSKWKVGDRVFGANFRDALLPSYLLIDEHVLLKVPEKMTCWEAATLPAVFLTAYYCLIHVAKLKRGETVLIHTGSGGVGLAAIQLAKHIGAEIITTAGNPRKRAYLRGLGIEHVFHSRDTSYEQDILRVTNGRGVDAVLNSITGPGIKEATLRATARNGRWVEMSKLSVWTNQEVMALRADVKYSIVDLTTLEMSIFTGLLKQISSLLTEGIINAIPFVRFDALCLVQAMQYLQKAKHVGKVIVTMPNVTLDHGQIKTNVELFHSEGTYLITGGLGGIGFEVCKWMLEKGAQDIVLVGRSAPKPEILQQISQLNDNGYNVVFKLGDISDLVQLSHIIEHIHQNMKPLRGIQHAAGVLRDNLYAQQTWQSFEATYNPKVTGTWNLHNLTKDIQLEHFVCYSSMTALLGTTRQANHASANCFEDAFVHYRHSLGQPGSHTINWGQWSQVGCAKDLSVPGILPCAVNRMLNGLELAMRTQREQVAIGDIDSFETLSMWCPLLKSYLDDRLLSAGLKAKPGLNVDQVWQEMDSSEEESEKVIVLSSYLKQIIRNGLRMEDNEPIGDDANLNDLGVDSLTQIELKNNIQTLFGSRLVVTSATLKGANTVRQMSTALVTNLMSEKDQEQEVLSPEELTALLQADCHLDDSVQPTGNQTVDASGMKTILVTGCTGQLGPYLIAELCKSYKFVEQIVCLVGSRKGVTPQERLEKLLKEMQLLDDVDMSKIDCVQGDVAAENFGLDKNEYLKLCDSVNGIIHLAAKANYVEPYRKSEQVRGGADIRTVNVEGTLNVLKFAANGKLKHVYYASAYTSIFGGEGQDTLCDEWPRLEEIETIVKFKIPGYRVSKFVGEMLVKQATNRGIPCKIFRFPWIAGENRTGRLNYENNHYILRLLSYLKLKVMPSLPFPSVMLPVDICAELSLKLFLSNKAPFEVYNIGPPNPELEQNFVELAKQEFDVTVEHVNWQEFSDKLETDSTLRSFNPSYTDVGWLTSLFTTDTLYFFVGFLRNPDTYFSNKKLSTYIPGWENNIASSMNIIRKDLRYVKSTGYLEKLNIYQK